MRLMTALDIAKEKHLAAARSLDFVKDGMCLGLGSGSTAAIMLQLLGERMRDENLRISGIPTSDETEAIARQLGIPIERFDENTSVDLTIDGADEADGDLNLIKGGGGALLREKIVASLSKQVVIIVDSTKQVETLGRFPLPVEVVKFAWKPIARRLQEMGGQPNLRTRNDGQPYVADEGNYILDCSFGRIDDANALGNTLDTMPGVMGHGLFVGIADVLIIGNGEQTQVINRQ